MGGLREAARFFMAVRRTGRGVMRGRLGLPGFNRFLLGSWWSRDPTAHGQQVTSSAPEWGHFLKELSNQVWDRVS